MGIKGLNKFIQIYAPGAINELSVSDLKNKTIAFDTSILIYQFVIAIRNTGYDLMNNDGKITSHIHAIIMKTLSFLKKEINPIYVFDGKPPQIKMDTLKERSKNRQAAISQLKDETNFFNKEQKIKLLKQSVVITGKQMDQCKEVLRLIGIPVIDALEEADPQCALLSKLNLVDAVASEDMDLLTFGVEKLLKNVNASKITEISLSKILSETGLTQDKFIDLCILMGCDYAPTIDGIGMNKAYMLIKKYGSLDVIVNLPVLRVGQQNIQISSEFRNKYQIARDYFKNPPVNHNIGEIKWNKPDYDKLQDLLINKYSYSFETINKILIKPLNGGHYPNIAGKTNNQLMIDREFSTYMSILNIPNQTQIYNQSAGHLNDISIGSLLDDSHNKISENELLNDNNFIDTEMQDNLDVKNILSITNKNNIKNLINN